MNDYSYDYKRMIRDVFSESPFYGKNYVIKREDNTKYQMEIYNFDKDGSVSKYQRNRRILGGAEIWTYINGQEYEHYFEEGMFQTYKQGEYRSGDKHYFISHNYSNWTKDDEHIPIDIARKNFHGPFFDSSDEFMEYF